MFEDSLVESQGRIRTRTKWLAIGSFCVQAMLLLLLVLFPLIHPEALPKQSMQRLLLAPLPPEAPAPVQAHTTTAASHSQMPSLEAQQRAPDRIPTATAQIDDGGPPTISSIGGPAGDGPGVLGGINFNSPPPMVIAARPPAPKRPLAVSSGVAAGQLLRAIQPVYPAIAKAARIQGTVVIVATISRQGAIENLNVTEGPPMLRQAAIDAVAGAKYRPFLLNGEPVEVQTSIHVIFSLGG